MHQPSIIVVSYFIAYNIVAASTLLFSDYKILCCYSDAIIIIMLTHKTLWSEKSLNLDTTGCFLWQVIQLDKCMVHVSMGSSRAVKCSWNPNNSTRQECNYNGFQVSEKGKH